MRRARGFSLVEVAIVLAVLGLALAAALSVFRPQVISDQKAAAEARLETVAEALVLYAARHARLPCPADATVNDGVAQVVDLDAGVCADGDRYSAVPWRALGIERAAAIDPWGRLIAYRVDDDPAGAATPDGLTRRDGFTSQSCSCPGAACAPEGPGDPTDWDDGSQLVDCIRDEAWDEDTRRDNIRAWLRGKGLELRDAAGDAILDPDPAACPVGGGACDGAAFVLISFGENGRGGYGAGGSRLAEAPAGTAERENSDLDAVYVTAEGMAPPDTEFDDLVHALSIDELSCLADLRAVACD